MNANSSLYLEKDDGNGIKVSVDVQDLQGVNAICTR